MHPNDTESQETVQQPQVAVIRAFEISPQQRELLISRLSAYSDPIAQQLVAMLGALRPIEAEAHPLEANRKQRRAAAKGS